jgi:membrane-bound lytic murein transglycosylase D
MRIISVVLASVLALPAMAQEVVETAVEEGVVVADSVSEHPTFGAMDEAALEVLEARLAALDSQHLMYAMAQVPEADTLSPLALEDSVFAFYMAELDARTPFEMAYNPVVKRYMERYLKHGSSRLSRMMAHGQYYFPMFEEHLTKYDMPLELKYLAVVESALNPKAKSHVGATGLWQFMYGTGKIYGLKVNSYVDDPMIRSRVRRRPVSTC